MITPHNRFDGNMESNGPANKMTVGDHVFNEGYDTGEKSIMELLSANELLVNKYTEQLTNHFGSMLANLPESLQESFINSIRVFDDNHDVMYKSMVAAYDGRTNSNPLGLGSNGTAIA